MYSLSISRVGRGMLKCVHTSININKMTTMSLPPVIRSPLSHPSQHFAGPPLPPVYYRLYSEPGGAQNCHPHNPKLDCSLTA